MRPGMEGLEIVREKGSEGYEGYVTECAFEMSQLLSPCRFQQLCKHIHTHTHLLCSHFQYLLYTPLFIPTHSLFISTICPFFFRIHISSPPSFTSPPFLQRYGRVGVMSRKRVGKRKEAWEAGGQPFDVSLCSCLHSPDYIPSTWLDSFSNFLHPKEAGLRRSSWLTALTHFGLLNASVALIPLC